MTDDTMDRMRSVAADIRRKITGLTAALAGVESGIKAFGGQARDFVDVSDHRSPAPKKRARRTKSTPKPGPTPKKRQMTPEGRARIAAAQRKRWAKVNEGSVTA